MCGPQHWWACHMYSRHPNTPCLTSQRPAARSESYDACIYFTVERQAAAARIAKKAGDVAFLPPYMSPSEVIWPPEPPATAQRSSGLYRTLPAPCALPSFPPKPPLHQGPTAHRTIARTTPCIPGVSIRVLLQTLAFRKAIILTILITFIPGV